MAAAADLPSGVALSTWDDLEKVPPFSEDLEAGPAPVGVSELRRFIGGADAVLIVTPEYNGSVPGQLKNALDWASRPSGADVLEGKPVSAIASSPSPRGGAWALTDLRKVLTVIGVDLVEADLAVGQIHTRLDAEGHISEPDLARRIAQLIGELARHAGAPRAALALR